MRPPDFDVVRWFAVGAYGSYIGHPLHQACMHRVVVLGCYTDVFIPWGLIINQQNVAMCIILMQRPGVSTYFSKKKSFLYRKTRVTVFQWQSPSYIGILIFRRKYMPLACCVKSRRQTRNANRIIIHLDGRPYTKARRACCQQRERKLKPPGRRCCLQRWERKWKSIGARHFSTGKDISS